MNVQKTTTPCKLLLQQLRHDLGTENNILATEDITKTNMLSFIGVLFALLCQCCQWKSSSIVFEGKEGSKD